MLNELLQSLNMPILFSGLTTIAGILGLLTHSVIPARQVGILAASGVSMALLMSLLLIPALIYLRNPMTDVKNDKKRGNRFFNGTLVCSFGNNCELSTEEYLLFLLLLHF